MQRGSHANELEVVRDGACAVLREGRDARPGVAVVVAFADAIIRMEDA